MNKNVEIVVSARDEATKVFEKIKRSASEKVGTDSMFGSGIDNTNTANLNSEIIKGQAEQLKNALREAKTESLRDLNTRFKSGQISGKDALREEENIRKDFDRAFDDLSNSLEELTKQMKRAEMLEREVGRSEARKKKLSKEEGGETTTVSTAGAKGGRVGGGTEGTGIMPRGMMMGNLIQMLGLIGLPLTIGSFFSTMMKNANEMDKSVGDINKLRGAVNPNYGQLGGREFIQRISTMFAPAMDMDTDEFLTGAHGMAIRSGSSKNALLNYAMSASVEKGYGLQSGTMTNMSVYDRQEKTQEKAYQVSLRMLNTLVNVDKSGIKKDDITLFGEKLQAFSQIRGLQSERGEKIDSGTATRVLAAFNQLGGSGSDQRAGQFISNVDRALINPTNERLQVLQYEAIAKAYPSLRGDYAGMERVREKGIGDTKYAAEFIKLLEGVSGGRNSDFFFNMKTAFPGLSPEQRDMLVNKDFLGTLSGDKVVPEGKEFTPSDALNQLRDNVNDISLTLKQFSAELKSFMSSLSRGNIDWGGNMVGFLNFSNIYTKPKKK